MTIRLDGANASAITPGYANRQEMDASAQRWMQELERAAFGARKAPAAVPPRDQRLPGAASNGSAPAAVQQGNARVQVVAAAVAPVRPAQLPLAAWTPLALPVEDAPAAAPGASPPPPVLPVAVTREEQTSTPAATVAAPLPRPLRQARVESQPDVQAPPAPPDPDTQYAAAHLQLFADGDGLHAYIRDAALGPERARSVGAAMAGAVAAEGRQLTQLTVNGHRVALPGARDPSANGAAPPPPWYPQGEAP